MLETAIAVLLIFALVASFLLGKTHIEDKIEQLEDALDTSEAQLVRERILRVRLEKAVKRAD